MIEIDGLSKKYQTGELHPLRDLAHKVLGREPAPSFWALKDISFNVNAGDVVGIIGPNGAGKSTLLKILSGIALPTEGEARLYGRVGALLEVGTGFHPELTGRENVFLNGGILGLSAKEVTARFDDIVAFSEVGKFIDTPVKRYSSGMRLRLAFSVAAHLDPEILIVDEVLAVGDVHFQRRCLGKLEEVRNQGRTVLFVSHNMAAIRDLCSRVIVLKQGRVAYDGPTEQGIESYLALAAEGLSNQNPISFEPVPKLPAALERASLETSTGRVTSTFDWADEIVVKAEFSVRHPSPEFFGFFFLYDGGGTTMLVSTDEEASEPILARAPRGRYRLTARIPAKVLRPGVYSFGIGVAAVGGKIDRKDRILSFEVIDTSSMRAQRGLYKRPFLIAPEIVWASEQLDDKQTS